LETSKKAEERREEALKVDIEAKQWTAKAEEARYHRDIAQLETEKVRLEKEKNRTRHRLYEIQRFAPPTTN